jgi:hypothetical protein
MTKINMLSFPLLLIAMSSPQPTDAGMFGFFSSKPLPELGPALIPYEVKIRNTKFLYSTINQGTSLDWPSEEMKAKAGQNAWGDWKPKAGMKASVKHGWGTGKKWLLHFEEADKYVVVGDAVISSTWKEGKKFWYDHHVRKKDPRHQDNILKRDLQAKLEGNDPAKPSKGSCRGGKAFEMSDIPLWVICVTVLVFGSFIVMGFLFIRDEWNAYKRRVAKKSDAMEEQAAGQSSEEEKSTENKEEEKTEKKKNKKIEHAD